jgi:surfactin synthase thioesterase subunit
MGTMVSFELARELRRRRLPEPSALFLSAGRAPHLPDPDPPIHQLPDAAFIAELRARYDGIPGEVLSNEELLELVLPGLRGDMKLLETHDFAEEEPLEMPITCFGGRDDSRLSHEDLEGWARHTRGAFVLRRLPGDHFFLHSHRALLLQYLADDLIQLMNRGDERAAAPSISRATR